MRLPCSTLTELALWKIRTGLPVSVLDSSMRCGSTGQLSLACAASYLAGLNGAALPMVGNILVSKLRGNIASCVEEILHPIVSDLHHLKIGRAHTHLTVPLLGLPHEI